MDTYNYNADNCDPATLNEYLKTNLTGYSSLSTAGSKITITADTDQASVDTAMDAYLAQDNILLAKQAMMWEAIKAERDRRTLDGFYEANTGKWFHSDHTSRTQHLGLMLLGANVPADLNWKTMDGTFVLMTQAIAADVFAAEAASDQAIFAAAEVHKAAMLLEADPETYDYLSSGWPLAYGE